MPICYCVFSLANGYFVILFRFARTDVPSPLALTVTPKRDVSCFTSNVITIRLDLSITSQSAALKSKNSRTSPGFVSKFIHLLDSDYSPPLFSVSSNIVRFRYCRICKLAQIFCQPDRLTFPSKSSKAGIHELLYLLADDIYRG